MIFFNFAGRFCKLRIHSILFCEIKVCDFHDKFDFPQTFLTVLAFSNNLVSEASLPQISYW